MLVVMAAKPGDTGHDGTADDEWEQSCVIAARGRRWRAILEAAAAHAITHLFSKVDNGGAVLAWRLILHKPQTWADADRAVARVGNCCQTVGLHHHLGTRWQLHGHGYRFKALARAGQDRPTLACYGRGASKIARHRC